VDPFTNTPFAALTIIVAPAILTNASSVLCLGTGNRIARVVDRTRILAADLSRIDPNSPHAAAYRDQLRQLKVRANLLMRAMRCFYLSIGAFAAAALTAVVGTALAAVLGDVVFRVVALLGLAAGTTGVAGLVIGGAVMVRETQVAVRLLEREAEFMQKVPPGDGLI
jgi:hypothetical protein